MSLSEHISTIRLPRELHEAAVERAEQTDRTLSGLIRAALKHYLATVPK